MVVDYFPITAAHALVFSSLLVKPLVRKVATYLNTSLLPSFPITSHKFSSILLQAVSAP